MNNTDNFEYELSFFTTIKFLLILYVIIMIIFYTYIYIYDLEYEIDCSNFSNCLEVKKKGVVI
jgi:hypothetical protein